MILELERVRQVFERVPGYVDAFAAYRSPDDKFDIWREFTYRVVNACGGMDDNDKQLIISAVVDRVAEHLCEKKLDSSELVAFTKVVADRISEEKDVAEELLAASEFRLFGRRR